MMDNIARTADVIARCWPNGRGVRKDDSAILARALADEEVLGPELPEPTTLADDGLWAEWEIGFDTVIADGPRVWGGGYREPLTSAEARALGLALLAAANHATQEKK